jgi:hypothetical protein
MRAEISVAESCCITFYIHLPFNVIHATNARAPGAQGTTANMKGTIPQPSYPCQGQDSRELPRLKSTQHHRGSCIVGCAPRGCRQRRNEWESKASTPKTLPPQSSHIQGGHVPQGKWKSMVRRRTRVASPAGCTTFHPPSG